MNATSTLRGHITREGGEHYRYYREMCEKHNIPAIAKSPDVNGGDGGGGSSRQSDIGSFTVVNPKTAAWSKEGLISHLCEWIVLDDQVKYYILLHTINLLTHHFLVIFSCRETIVQDHSPLSAPQHGSTRYPQPNNHYR